MLVIDDDEATCFFFKVAIEKLGHMVFTAENGQDGLRLLGVMPKPALILLDLMMPVMDGRQFLAAITANPAWRDVPVVVATAFGDTPALDAAKEILHKPIELSQLTQTVRRWCGDQLTGPP